MNSSGKVIKTGVGFQTNLAKNDIAVNSIDTYVEFAIFPTFHRVKKDEFQ